MREKFLNVARIEGVLYQHNLELKVTGKDSKKPGTEYISGSIFIATNDKKTNIVPVTYTYETFYKGKTKDGKDRENPNYTILKNIIDGKIGCYTDPEVGENAAKMRIDSAIELNEFWSERTGEMEWVSNKRCGGGFIHMLQSLKENETQRNAFETDIVIVNVREKDPIEDSTGHEIAPAKGIVSGYIFNWRADIMPVEFSVINPKAIAYFLDLGASKKNPVFTKVKGQIIDEQITTYIREESAFGEDSVREVQTNNKDFVITWAAVEPYEFGLESTVTIDDIKAKLQNRETMKAERKQNRLDYKARQQNNAFDSAPAQKAAAPSIPDDDFGF